MTYNTPVTLIMLLCLTAFSILGVLIITPPVPCAPSTTCGDGRVCPAHFTCCDSGCCAPLTPPPRRDVEDALRAYARPWYTQWPVLFLLGTLGGILMCCIYCLFIKRNHPRHGVYMCSFVCCMRRPRSARDSTGSLYAPPRYSRCGSFHTAPPPYSEVTAKPDLYPLVITCGEGEGKSPGTYLMVHYFRNYVIGASGSLSAASTAESLNSSFICNAANEANSIIPPPYSCASGYEECGSNGIGRGLLRSLSSLTDRDAAAPPPPRSRTAPDATPRARPPPAFRDNLITSPVQPLDPAFDLELELIDCEMYCDGGCKPRLGSSPPSRSPLGADEACEREARALRRLLRGEASPTPACPSPPRPTSPTQSRESTLQRPERAKRTRKSSVYLPLHSAGQAKGRARSEPATPCGALVPNLLTLPHRMSSRYSSRASRCGDEGDPLLFDVEQGRSEHKF
ncbi:uncharacterized protein LOC113237556 isoform X1 [Hyposmocoma kahamanoa]|uniref:uncharacterized protein LOC113237556 isoform X1 n=1 Tax=Hyposmocoma kahamanoa TaxID=1477025 RepID=UPI000E6D5D99|nr:uncharacterized protein LOC113237556 isoform X1 [Hyposmocoma kahamanoa]